MFRLEGLIEQWEKEGAILELSDHSRICVAQKVLPEHARTGDYLVLDPIENRFRVDQTITELHRQAARRLAEYFFD